MEMWCLSKYKSSLLIYMMLLLIMVGWIQGLCIEEERKALLEIKASLHELSNYLHVDNLLHTWVDNGSCGENYCDWERIKCNTTSGYVTELSLRDMFFMQDDDYLFFVYEKEASLGRIWPLNASLFLHFRELRSLDLSKSYIGNAFVSTGLKKLSSLTKLEILNLSYNYIETDIFPSLREFASLRILDLSYLHVVPKDSPTHDISKLPALRNLEELLLGSCGYYGTLRLQVLSKFTNLKKLDLSDNFYLNNTSIMKGCKSLMRLKELESVSLAANKFNKSIISCLSFLPSLKILDLSNSNDLGSSFPMQELSSLKELKILDLSDCQFESLAINGTMTNLLHLTLDYSSFISVDDTMRSMGAAFPSLRFLSLKESFQGGSLFTNDVPTLPYLEVLILSDNRLNGTLPMQALASFHRLKVLDLGGNKFYGSIPSTIKLLCFIKVVSFTNNALNGSLVDDGLCELANLRELDLSQNMFDGNVPRCLNRLSSLKLFDISSNQFTGILPSSLFVNLTSIEYIDFSHNKFEGSFSLSSLSNHTKLEVFRVENDNDQFEVETEDPAGWLPMFQLKVLILVANGNIKKAKRSVPRFLLHQHKLGKLDLSHNSLEGEFPNWLFKNNTKLEVLNLRNNSLGGVICMELKYAVIRRLDVSGNHIAGSIPNDIHKFIPRTQYLNFSGNALNGGIPSAIGEMRELLMLDLSHNEFSGEVPKGLFGDHSTLMVIKLSKNKLNGQILSGNLSLGGIQMLHLDGNDFTGNIGNKSGNNPDLIALDFSDNLFTGTIPGWIGNMPYNSEIVLRNNSFEGQFPCGYGSFKLLDISQNSFSGPLPSCLNFKHLRHLHLSFNIFTGSVPDAFRNLTRLLILDIGHNYLSGRIPKFLGELSNLRILLLGNNKFVGSIPKQLCHLNNVSLIDLSSNSLTGLIPGCLQNITGPKNLAFRQQTTLIFPAFDFLSKYDKIFRHSIDGNYFDHVEIRDEAQFTTKSNSQKYQGNILDYMSGLDLSSNKLWGEIPHELGDMTHILALNLSHNQLTGPIPVSFSNLTKIESLDLSSNSLSGKLPSELIKLTSLEVFNVSYNNLSGRLPEWKAQFATFTAQSYKGNPLLCGQPLENKCTTEPQVSGSSTEEDSEKWYNIDKTSFYGSSGSTWFVFMLGFAGVLYINPYWRRRWLEFVEECMYSCYYFLYDSVSKVYMLFH